MHAFETFQGIPALELPRVLNTRTEISKLNLSEAPNSFEKDILSYYLMGVTSMFICCLGATGNILSLIVLTRRAVGSPTTNLYLISLAVADLLVLLATILTALKDSRKPEKGQLNILMWQDAPIIPRTYPYFHATAILFQVTSVWLTVAFTSDRYLMICHPFVAKRWCTVHSTRYVIIAIYVASAIYGLPRYFEYQEFEIYLPTDIPQDLSMLNRSVLNGSIMSNQSQLSHIVWYDLSEFGSSPSFMHVYHLWSWNIMVVSLPLLIIAVMNSFLIYEVRKSISRNVYQFHRKPTRRQDTDVMLIGVVIVFIICQIPAAISHFSWSLIPLEDTKSLPWYLLNEIGNLLIVINSAINLVLYYLFSRRFRKHFLQLFCPYRVVRDNGLHCVHIPRWVTGYWEVSSSPPRRSTLEAGIPTNWCEQIPISQQQKRSSLLTRSSAVIQNRRTLSRTPTNRIDRQPRRDSRTDQPLTETVRDIPIPKQKSINMLRRNSSNISSSALRCCTPLRIQRLPAIAINSHHGFVTNEL